MLVGQDFKEQLFESHVFALFINTFLGGKSGIINGYRNSMKINNSSNSVTIGSGIICVKGRFLEEDSESTVNVENTTAYCKLVIEIDLDKENSETEFNQGRYKIIKGASAYPNLIQNDIVNTNSGIFQYELARFKTGLNGITDFIDQRTYIDFNSFYNEIERKITEIEDGSAFVRKSELLWENKNSSTKFLAQTVELKENNYNWFRIEYIRDKDTPDIKYYLDIKVGDSFDMYLNTWYTPGDLDKGFIKSIMRTYCRSTQKSIIFSDALRFTSEGKQNKTYDNLYMIPLKIYGYNL